MQRQPQQYQQKYNQQETEKSKKIKEEFSIPIIKDLETLTCKQWVDLLDYLNIEYKKIHINCRYNLFFVYNKAMRNKENFKKMLKSENFLIKNFGINFKDIVKNNMEKPEITNKSTKKIQNIKDNYNNTTNEKENHDNKIDASKREGVLKRKNYANCIEIYSHKITKIKGQINYVEIYEVKKPNESENEIEEDKNVNNNELDSSSSFSFEDKKEKCEKNIIEKILFDDKYKYNDNDNDNENIEKTIFSNYQFNSFIFSKKNKKFIKSKKFYENKNINVDIFTKSNLENDNEIFNKDELMSDI